MLRFLDRCFIRGDSPLEYSERHSQPKIQILGASQFIHRGELEAFLKTTASAYGGYGKHPDAFPDILHSYLGLCGLSLIKHPGLQKLNAELCMPERYVPWTDFRGCILKPLYSFSFKFLRIFCLEIRGRTTLQGGFVTLLDILPVHNAPDGLEVIRADVLVLQVISVFPDINAENRDHGCQRVLVSSGGNFQFLRRLIVGHCLSFFEFD